MSQEFEGKFIALEGPDGCGKSTQVKLLSEWLRSEGYEVKVTKEPTENPVGKILRNSLEGKIKMPTETQALLFAGDRIMHITDVVAPNLNEGKIVVTGRYIYSSLAYQTSLGLSRNWIEKINKFAIEPDLTLIIDVPPSIGSERVNSEGNSDEFEKDLELQRRVRETYQELARENNLPIIDGTREKEKVHEEIKKEVSRILHADLSR